MQTPTSPDNPVNFFQSDSEIALYLSDAFMDDDPNSFVVALGHVAKAKGIAKLARDTGLNRESLYKALSGKTQPRWDTVQRIIKALNMNVKLTL